MRLTFVLGTRPEVIKLAPVILEAQKRRHHTKVILTGQHAQLAGPLLEFFGIKPTLDLNVMSANQSLTSLSARLLEKLDGHKDRLQADFLLTQGDTTSAFIASYWAFCNGIQVAHVEAGLRTHNIRNPFPEEANRQLIGRIADLHFAPTQAARSALRKENISKSRIHVVGNTGIDALFFSLEKIQAGEAVALKERLNPEVLKWAGERRIALVTAHRRESFGQPLQDLCHGLLKLVDAVDDLCIIYPVHPNPNVQKQVKKLLAKHPKILLIEPLPYVAFVTLMQKASIILTDSGGVQEEAPSLKKPILVLRETSERPEGIRKGFAKLVGTNPETIYREGLKALKKGCTGKGNNPYGDGQAAKKILQALERAKR